MHGVRTSLIRSCLLVLAAALVAAVDLPGRPQTLCLLRAATGVPCPLCGGTTAAVAVGQGRLLGAAAASPLVVLGALTLVVMPLLPRTARQRLDAHRTALLLTALGAGEGWQLLRLT